MVAHGTTYVLLSPRNDAAETWGFDCTGRRWTNSAQRSPLTAADRPRRTSAGTPGPWTRSGLIPAGPRYSPGAPNPYDSDPAGTADAARPAIYRTGLCRARRSCLARGITGLEYPAGRRGLCEPCSGGASLPVLRRRPYAFGSTAWRLWRCRLDCRVRFAEGAAAISGCYCPVAALNLTTSSAGTRPRSFTSMPWTLAHSRTSVAFSPFAGARCTVRAGRREPLGRRAALT